MLFRSVLRSDLIDSLANAKALLPVIFIDTGLTNLVLAGPNRAPDPGEGVDPTLNGTDDDDDLYDRRVAAPWTDPDATVADTNRPLVIYQMSIGGNTLMMTKSSGTVELSW